MRNGSNTLLSEHEPRAKSLRVDVNGLTIELIDGRKILVPLKWYPRLQCGTSKQRNNFRLIGEGVGIHWPDLDEDISIEAVLAGRQSKESQKSFRSWQKMQKLKACVSETVNKRDCPEITYQTISTPARPLRRLARQPAHSL